MVLGNGGVGCTRQARWRATVTDASILASLLAGAVSLWMVLALVVALLAHPAPTMSTLEREGDILLLSYEESELTGMEGTTTVFRVEPARITLQRSGTLESQMVFELGHEDRSLYDMGFGALMITVLTDRLENTLTDAGGEMDVSYSVAIENETAGHIDYHIHVRPQEA